MTELITLRPGGHWKHNETRKSVFVTNVGKDPDATIEFDSWDGETTHLHALSTEDFRSTYYHALLSSKESK